MKRTILLPLLLLTVSAVFSQQFQLAKGTLQHQYPRVANQSPDGAWPPHQATVPPSPGYRALEETIGHTTFDLQSIGSLGRRVGDLGGGKLSAIWHFGADQANNYPDRGAAYNAFDGTTWGPEPTSSVEETRSGYPSFAVSPNGTEVIASHKSTTGSNWILTVQTKKPGETTWTEHEIPSAVTGGPVWAKVAAGGPDGNTLHVVAVTVAAMFGGAVYEGMELHPLYWRSTDGGATWDKQDIIIPGWDSTFYHEVGGESYAIEARGETVVIASLESWGDVAIYKSIDNGDNWARTIVHDFPLDAYAGGGYTADDIPDDPNAPTDLAILTSDGSGSLVIDNDGKVHLFFSWLYVVENGVYLDMNGVAYWNEDHAPGQIDTIAGAEDYDGDGLITIGGDLGDYRYTNYNLSSGTSAGIDADGNLYVVYSAIREDFANTEDQNLRHLFVVKSEDGGLSWSAPFDLINEETTLDYEYIEAAYPAIPMQIGENINLVYMQDYMPGLTPTDNTVDPQNIVYLKLDKNTFGMISGAKELPVIAGSAVLVPNPTSGLLKLQYVSSAVGSVQISVYNLMGEQVLVSQEATQPIGQHSIALDLTGHPAGIYLVKMEIGGQTFTQKIMKK
ncbi:MAG: T9SS type A sorting domain-containing protein [Lewinellaceae bacterium]|nr:T9SS type A sorting domain-containing protein [Saprospiraceae bacterium]MCB9341525.1 T9SS type A sorting domain-containing protein [Lewinellaceae bacterium]